jgi:hypothetical protein
MWQLYYHRAREIHEERRREAEQARLARLEPGPTTPRRSRVTALRRTGARIAVRVARRIDPGAAREAWHGTPRDPRSIQRPASPAP